MLSRKIRWVVAPAFLALVCSAHTLAGEEVATITAESTPARVGAGTKFDAWRTFNKGESLPVIGRRGEWLRVRVPGYVDDRYVELAGDGKTGRVTAEALNVRGAPNKGPIMQWLARGDAVQVRGHRGHWMEIDSHTYVETAATSLGAPAQEPAPQTYEGMGPDDGESEVDGEESPVPPVAIPDETDLDEGLPLDLVPPVQPIEPLPIEPLPPVLDVPQLPLPNPPELPAVQSGARPLDGAAALRPIQGVPALAGAFQTELGGADREARAGALLEELLGPDRAALRARYAARFASPAALDEALDELRLRARRDPQLLSSLAARSGREQAPQDDLLVGTYRLDGKEGAARLTISRGEGEDLQVRREELGPNGAVSAVKTGFARLKKDDLEVTYANSRGALQQLQQTYDDVGIVIVPEARYELDLRTGRIRGRHYPRGTHVQDAGNKEEGCRIDRAEPVAGVYDLESGAPVGGNDPIELVVRARPDGRYDLVRTTRKGPRQVDILEGEGTLVGRELQTTFGDYTVREDGRIQGRAKGKAFGESGWKRGVVRPLAGEYVLRPTWYAFGKKPPIALSISETAQAGRLVVTRQAEGEAPQRGEARANGRKLEVRFEDGTRARYEVREDGKIEGAHQASPRDEQKSEGGWRSETEADPRWFDAALANRQGAPTLAR